MDINDFCSSNEKEIKQIEKYISVNGVDFETNNPADALSYFIRCNPCDGPVYVICTDGVYQFIRPASGNAFN
jgi:hypothetical protein